MRFIDSCLPLSMIILATSVPGPAAACSCARQSLSERYRESQVLVLVKAGAIRIDEGGEGGQRSGWSFEVLELFKGEPAFDTLWPTSSEESPCGAHLTEGARYLVSADARGRIGLCNAWPLDDNPRIAAEIDLLHAYGTGTIPGLTEPWIYTESDEICSLNHRLATGGGQLQFFYRFRQPEHPATLQYRYPVPPTAARNRQNKPAVEDLGPHPSQEPGFMNLRVRFYSGEYVRENTGKVVIGEREWHTRRSLMEEPWAMPYEVVEDKQAREILAALAKASSVSLTWEFSALPEYQQQRHSGYPGASAATEYLYFGDAMAGFQACLERGVIQAQ